MTDLKEMIIALIEELKGTTVLFYQQREHDGYKKMNQTITSISLVVEKLFLALGEDNHLVFSPEEFISNLNNAMNAMQEKDTVLLADILQYDLLEQLELIVGQL